MVVFLNKNFETYQIIPNFKKITKGVKICLAISLLVWSLLSHVLYRARWWWIHSIWGNNLRTNQNDWFSAREGFSITTLGGKKRFSSCKIILYRNLYSIFWSLTEVVNIQPAESRCVQTPFLSFYIVISCHGFHHSRCFVSGSSGFVWKQQALRISLSLSQLLQSLKIIVIRGCQHLYVD